MTVGYIADENDRTGLMTALDALGHTVTALADPAGADGHELVVLAVDESRLQELAETLSARARRGQIYLHTAVGQGAQVLDPLESAGAVVGALTPLTEDLWAVDALDELGHTVLELLVAELGVRAVTVGDTQRRRLVAGLTYARFARAIADDARLLLTEALGDPDAARGIALNDRRGHNLPGVEELMRQHDALQDPGMARAFRDMARRAAEQTNAHDIELWAMGENNSL